MAVAIAGILIVERKHKSDAAYYFSMACALIAMGILDIFHAAVLPGNSFVWLHSTATLAGGLFFATVWFNRSLPESRLAQAAIWFTLFGSCLLGLHACLRPNQLPLMFSNGSFTTLARWFNIWGGIGFLIAGAFFIRRFHLNAKHESWLFAVHTVLLGSAGILFELSSLWDLAWWWWHFLRISAYIAALAFAIKVCLDTEHQLLHLNRILQTTNQRLDNKVAQRTEELRLKEERFKLAVEGSTDGLWDWDIQTNKVFYATRFKELLGLRCDEMRDHFSEFESRLHPEDHDPIQAAIQRHLTLHEPYDVQYRLQLKNGAYRWFRARGQAIWNERGQATRMAGSITDIHDQKLAEDALEYEQFLLKTLLDNLPDEIAFKDTEGTFLRVSSALARRLGMENPKEVEGLSNYDFFPADYARKRLEQERELMQSGHPLVRKEEPMQGPHGENLMMLTTKIPMRNRQGTVIGTFGIAHDITDMKRAEERFRLVVEATPNPILLVNTLGTIQLANWAAFQMFGYELNVLIGMTLENLFATQQEDGHFQNLKELLKHPRAKLLTEPQEVNGLCQNGKTLPLEIRLIPVEIDGEQLVLISIFDMSVHKQVDETLKRAILAAEQANQEKNNFLANMSHEIRTPLNAIIGISEILLNSSLEPQQHEFLSIVLDSGESLLSIINDLLDFSKIESGKMELESIHFDLRQEIGNVFKLLSPRNHTKDLKISWQVQSEIPQYLIGDPTHLRQILMNLVGNAIKFTLKGEVVLNVERQEDDDDSLVHLLFAVHDTGIGIPPEQLDRIFSRFVQADSSTTRKFGGSGLGLTITTRIIEAMQGRILAQSEPGEGSLFQFTLAFPEGKAPDEPDSVNQTSRQTSADQQAVYSSSQQVTDQQGSPMNSLPPLRVLMAEDGRSNQLLVKTLLEKWGHTVTIAENGKIAVELWTSEPFDLILMDVTMPEMDGLEATRAIREQETLPGQHIPIIAMTARAMKGDLEQCLQAGMDGYVSKPIHKQELDAEMARFFPESTDTIQADPVTLNVPLVNWNEALRVVEDDEDLLCDLISECITELPELLDHLENALHNDDAATAYRYAHTTKAAARTFGISALFEQADLTEQAAALNDLATVREHLPTLRSLVSQVIPELDERLNRQV